GKDPGEKENPGENEEPGKDQKPGDDEKENPDKDKKPDDNKEPDNQKNPDIKDNPNNNDRPSYNYKYDYYDYYWHPNYDYLNSNRNNSSDIAKNKGDKDEERTKDENKEEINEEKITIPEAILNSYFSDIGNLPGHYQEAIIDLANRSVLIGTGKNNFDPHTSISRAMVAQVLYRLANDKAYVNPSDFTDSAPTNWFYTAVNWANEKELIKGFKDKTFKPNKSITNEELAVILGRAIEKLELKTSNINSINKDDYKFLADWNRDGIIKMLELDLMDFTFENNQVVVKEISRAEFANIIYKLINSLN
ncbi:MAG: S-layer homology domain-containing protein, partial [Ezakiella massiliensis]